MKIDSSQRTPAKTTGEPKPARRAGSCAPVGMPPVDADPVMAQAEGTKALADSMPHNANKARDFGRDSVVNPPIGLTAEPASDEVSACTLSEVKISAKTGDPASPAPMPSTVGWRKPGSMAPSRC